MHGAPGKQAGARSRVVLLGASNLARGMPTLIQIARQQLGGPIEFLIAAGLGRSYGQTSRFLTRERIGIALCGLWDELGNGACGSGYALLADVGNDLVYGASPAAIERWVETCLARLSLRGFRAVLLGLPLPSLRGLSAARYLFFRTLFFPSHRPSLADMLERAEELQERLRSLARRASADFVEVDASWYGFDPIHLSPLRSRRAWREILARWASSGGSRGEEGTGSSSRRVSGDLALWLRAGVVGELLGPRKGAVVLEDGSRIALF